MIQFKDDLARTGFAVAALLLILTVIVLIFG